MKGELLQLLLSYLKEATTKFKSRHCRCKLEGAQFFVGDFRELGYDAGKADRVEKGQ